MRTITRSDYAGMFGPTTGDRVRLGDTGLLIEVEKDYARYGDELKFGGGKSFRDGMGQSSVQKDSESPDTVITNALVVDYTGIYKADIGIKNGKISAIGKAGNPQTMDGVTRVLQSARARRQSPVKGSSSPPAASTPIFISSRRNKSARLLPAASPPWSAAAPGRLTAPTPPHARRARSTSPA